jgi:predicted phage terminase large subunit-like protein
LNARLKANGGFPLFRRAVGPDLEPVWPAKWPRDKLAERLAEVGAAAFARGYRLTAFDEQEVAVRPEWVRVWVDELPRDRFEAVVLAVDPAVSVNANADASALVVLGRVVGSNEVRVLEAGARRVSTPELVELIGAADQRWRPDAILFEANVAFAGIRDLLIRHARFGPRVKGEPAVRGKAARVAALSVPVQNGTVRLKGDAAGRADAGQRGLWEELTTFPFAAHDDQLDALAAGVEYLLGRPAPRVWV